MVVLGCGVDCFHSSPQISDSVWWLDSVVVGFVVGGLLVGPAQEHHGQPGGMRGLQGLTRLGFVVVQLGFLHLKFPVVVCGGGRDVPWFAGVGGSVAVVHS